MTLILAAMFAVLIVGAVVHRLLSNRAYRREFEQIPFHMTQPYVSQGGDLPDFLSGHDWPVNPNRRSAR